MTQCTWCFRPVQSPSIATTLHWILLSYPSVIFVQWLTHNLIVGNYFCAYKVYSISLVTLKQFFSNLFNQRLQSCNFFSYGSNFLHHFFSSLRLEYRWPLQFNFFGINLHLNEIWDGKKLYSSLKMLNIFHLFFSVNQFEAYYQKYLKMCHLTQLILFILFSWNIYLTG